jgi:isoleucyl-tRNA synthetase
MSYKNTLNLPKTDFSMKANLAILEPKMISRWKDLDIYRMLKEERKDCPKFILHDGPPYANGSIHIGHALNKILKDIIIKYKTVKGYDCPFIIGWDCHGLPVEHQLFKELKLTKHDVDVSSFRKKAKDYALKFVNLQKEDFKRLGIFGDWENPYLTLNPEYEHKVIKLLGDLVAQGYIYRGRKPVNWCSVCETALAEAEVEYADKESDSTYLLFRLKKEKDVYFLVWTTTPWTLVSNVALAVHPELEYCLVKIKDKAIIVAKNLIPSLEEKFSLKFDITKTYTGSGLEHLKLIHPFLERESPVVLADFVSKEEGSGCVHIAPGHGQEDFSLIKNYPDLEVIMPLDDKGIFVEPEKFKGKNTTQASGTVLEMLKNNGALFDQSKIKHSYPHCWRCKQPVIFRATYQWFFKVDHKDLRNKALKETEKVNWIPSSGKERMKSMLATRPDWCLSRQRLWGVPIPAIKCETCQEVILDQNIIGKVAEVFRKEGSDAWFNLGLEKFLPQGFICPKCKGKEFSKERDILDVWFESGASFRAVLETNPELGFPADLYLEGSDQHRGWFQVSLIPAVAKAKKAPFKAVLTHGFVVDSEGRKMSKSLGNVITPQDISKKYGSEILRLWAAYTDYSEDVKISQDILKQLVDMYRKVRNTIKFIMGNISDFSLKDNPLKLEELREVDRYMLAWAMVNFKEILKCYEDFSFYKACQKIFNFCNLDLSSFYLDILKDRLYTFPQGSKPRRSGQFVLYHILEVLLKLISPILSFTAEEAYLAKGKPEKSKESIFVSRLDAAGIESFIDQELLEAWKKIISLRGQVLKEIEKKREQGLIGSSLEAEVRLNFREADYKFYKSYQEILREVFIVSSVLIEEGSFEIIVNKAQGKKCLRCWNWSASVGKSDKYSDICSRCIEALKEVNR